jgi:hypothetical protein
VRRRTRHIRYGSKFTRPLAPRQSVQSGPVWLCPASLCRRRRPSSTWQRTPGTRVARQTPTRRRCPVKEKNDLPNSSKSLSSSAHIFCF